MIDYQNLFSLLKKRNIKKTELLKIISSGSLSKLTKGQNLQTEVIEKICNFLSVQPGEIMTYTRIYIDNIEPNEEIYYNTGYRQRLCIQYPSEIDELMDLDSNERKFYSKKIHTNIKEIETGKVNIPNDFIEDSQIQKIDPKFQKALKQAFDKNTDSN